VRKRGAGGERAGSERGASERVRVRVRVKVFFVLTVFEQPS